jgi:hypothetical protein
MELARMKAAIVLVLLICSWRLPAQATDFERSEDSRSTGEQHDYKVFAASSFWYQPIPANAPLNPDSDGMLQNFLAQIRSYYGDVNLNISSWTAPIYEPAAATQTVTVKQREVLNAGLTEQWAAVPIPSCTQIPDSTDTDKEVVIYQPSTDEMWEFWQLAHDSNGAWSASWGGEMQNVSLNNGIWANPYGATATGLPLIGGQLSIDELSAGEIKHAIGIALVETAPNKVISWPANRSDGGSSRKLPGTLIPEGLRFRLDPTINVEALKLTPIAKMVAKAAQIYGFVVWDRSGSVSLRAENPLSRTALGKPNPYWKLTQGVPQYTIFNNFPWDHLQFLPMNYGKS